MAMVEQKSPFDRTIAVVIGINNYQNGINSLKTAVPDAAAIADLLKAKQGYEIFPEVILDAAATCDRLKTLLKEELPQHVGKGDRVLFYFAGHGVALDGHDGPEGYLVPQNAKPGDKDSMLPMQMLHDELAKLDCRHLLLILDCCFAGAFRWSANYRDVGLEEDLNEQRYQYFIQQPAWQIITSAGSDERAIDVLALRDQRGQIGNHSPFAQVLLEALAGGADRYPAAKNGAPAGDGVITANELITYIESEFSERLQDQAINQTPGLWCFRKHANGRYIFDNPDHPHRALKDAPLLDESTNPYRGLASFEKEHKDLFFGRHELTDILTEFVKQRPLTIVLGTSGSGKSSLVKAGLIPNIEALQNGQRWAILPFRPEHSPFASLNQVLGERGLPKIKNPLQPNSLEPAADPEHPLEQTLSVWLQAHSDTQLLVVIDQFEELVTLSSSKERQLFLEILATAIEKYAKQLHLVITLRSDFEPQFKASPLAPFWNNANFFITTPMSRANLRQAIEKPADKRTFFFESKDPENSLVDRLINEVEGMPGALPLLSFALSQLYLNYLGRQEATRQQGLPAIDRAITEADYQKLGSVQQSITKRADDIYDQLREGKVGEGVLEKVRQKFRESSLVNVDSVKRQLQQIRQSGVSDRVIRNVMLRMVSTTGIARSRRPVQCSELEYPEPDCIPVVIVLEMFEQERLLTTDKDAAGNAYIEPAHDALILNWSKINLWLNERQDKVETKRQFALLPVLPAFLKMPEVASNHSKSGNTESEAPLKVNLELQRELTIASSNWLRMQEQEEKGNHKAIGFLWNADPRLPQLEQILLSNDNWFNKTEKRFLQHSLKRRQENRRRTISFVSAAFAVVLGFAGFQLNQNQEAQSLNLATSSEKLFTTTDKQLDALLESLKSLKALKGVILPKVETTYQILGSLQQKVYNIKQRNEFRDSSIGQSISFSPKGQIVAWGSDDGTIKLWNLGTGEIRTFKGHNGGIRSVSFSPNGQILASGSDDQTIKLWNLDTGTEIRTFKGHDKKVNSVSFSPDGQMIASGSDDKMIKLWNLDTGTEIRTLQGHNDPVTSVNFSPKDGGTLASSSDDKTIKLWSLKTSKEIFTFRGHDGKVNSVGFSPDGQMIASGSDDKTIKLWNLKTGKIHTLQHNGVVRSVSFSPDGKTLASGADGTVKLWSVEDSKLVDTFEGVYIAYSVSFSPDGQTIASVNWDGSVRLWSVGQDNHFNPIGNSDIFWSTAFSPDGRTIASGDTDGNIKLGNLDTGEIRTFKGNHGAIRSVNFSPNGQMIASGSDDGTIKLWSLDTGKEIRTIKGHNQPVSGISFDLKGHILASASWDGTVKLWKLEDREPEPFREYRNQQPLNSVIFSPNGKIIASGSIDGTIQLRNSDTGEEIHTLKSQNARIWGIGFSPDGHTIASAEGPKNTVKLWNVADGKELRTLEGHKAEVFSVSFTPDGKIIASASSDGTIKLWSFAGKELTTLRVKGLEAPIWSVNFSPDGKTIVSGSGSRYEGALGKVIVWNLNSDYLLARGCEWIADYLKNNSNGDESDRQLCDNVPKVVAKGTNF